MNFTKRSTCYRVCNYGLQCSHCEVYSEFLGSLLWVCSRLSKHHYIDTLHSNIQPIAGKGAIKQIRDIMDRIGNQLLKEGKAALAEANGEKDKKSKKRDLLSLLLKANLSPDIPESQRMNDRDVLARKSLCLPHNDRNWTYSRGQHVPRRWPRNHQVYSILSRVWFCDLRRHDSNATTWALYALSIHSDIQSKLRDELFTIHSDNPTMDELNSLSYLDSVVRETLRIHTPVAGTMKVAVKDDVVPLGTPFVDKKGKICDNILWAHFCCWRLNMMEWFVLRRVRKGQTVLIPILPINRSESLWGKDAREFKYVYSVSWSKLLIDRDWDRPERWESSNEAASAIPGVWGNMLSFLGGPHACIGYRFSLVEYVSLPNIPKYADEWLGICRMKALLFTVVRAFEFELAVPVGEIGTNLTAFQKPFLINDPKAGSQLPLLLKLYVHVNWLDLLCIAQPCHLMNGQR